MTRQLVQWHWPWRNRIPQPLYGKGQWTWKEGLDYCLHVDGSHATQWIHWIRFIRWVRHHFMVIWRRIIGPILKRHLESLLEESTSMLKTGTEFLPDSVFTVAPALLPYTNRSRWMRAITVTCRLDAELCLVKISRHPLIPHQVVDHVHAHLQRLIYVPLITEWHTTDVLWMLEEIKDQLSRAVKPSLHRIHHFHDVPCSALLYVNQPPLPTVTQVITTIMHQLVSYPHRCPPEYFVSIIEILICLYHVAVTMEPSEDHLFIAPKGVSRTWFQTQHALIIGQAYLSVGWKLPSGKWSRHVVRSYVTYQALDALEELMRDDPKREAIRTHVCEVFEDQWLDWVELVHSVLSVWEHDHADPLPWHVVMDRLCQLVPFPGLLPASDGFGLLWIRLRQYTCWKDLEPILHPLVHLAWHRPQRIDHVSIYEDLMESTRHYRRSITDTVLHAPSMTERFADTYYGSFVEDELTAHALSYVRLYPIAFQHRVVYDLKYWETVPTLLEHSTEQVWKQEIHRRWGPLSSFCR
jgi:hypothetical protein